MKKLTLSIGIVLLSLNSLSAQKTKIALTTGVDLENPYTMDLGYSAGLQVINSKGYTFGGSYFEVIGGLNEYKRYKGAIISFGHTSTDEKGFVFTSDLYLTDKGSGVGATFGYKIGNFIPAFKANSISGAGFGITVILN